MNCNQDLANFYVERHHEDIQELLSVIRVEGRKEDEEHNEIEHG